jgi:O-antigen ligase
MAVGGRIERLAFNLGPRRAVAQDETPAQAPATPVVAAREVERDRLAFNALLAFMLVLLIRPQDQLFFLEPLHLADLTGAFAFLALIAGRVGRGLPATRFTPEVLGVFAFAGVMLATMPVSFWPGGSFEVFTTQFGKIVLIFLVIVNTLTSRARVERYITVVTLGATYVGLRAVFDYARGVNLVEGGRVAGSIGGLFGNPNDMALNMVTFLPLAIAVALYRGRTSLRLIGTIGAAAMALAMVFSKSRGGTVGMIAMMAVLIYQMRRVRPGVAVLIVVASLAALPMLPASFTERMASIFDADQDPTGSREARKRLLREGWETFLGNPLTGVGLGQFPNYRPDAREEAWRQTHNSPLQVASELGIVGLGIFAFMVWTALNAGIIAKRAIRGARRRARIGRRTGPRSASDADLDWLDFHAGIILAAVFGWFVAANFASVAYYWTFYLMLGLAAAIREVSVQAARTHSDGARTDRRALRVA